VQFGQRTRQVGHVLQDLHDDGSVATPGRERERLGICDGQQAALGQPGLQRPFPCRLHHGRLAVDPDGPPVRPHRRGQLGRHVAGTAADVEHDLAGRRGQEPVDRAALVLYGLYVVGPAQGARVERPGAAGGSGVRHARSQQQAAAARARPDTEEGSGA